MCLSVSLLLLLCHVWFSQIALCGSHFLSVFRMRKLRVREVKSLPQITQLLSEKHTPNSLVTSLYLILKPGGTGMTLDLCRELGISRLWRRGYQTSCYVDWNLHKNTSALTVWCYFYVSLNDILVWKAYLIWNSHPTLWSARILATSEATTSRLLLLVVRYLLQVLMLQEETLEVDSHWGR